MDFHQIQLAYEVIRIFAYKIFKIKSLLHLKPQKLFSKKCIKSSHIPPH